MNTKIISFHVNGHERTLEVRVGESLLDVLRNRLHLTGTKSGCNVGECGACTVLVDGESIDSCLFLAVQVNGKKVETIEGERKGDKISSIQQAYVEEQAIQCGFCTPGFVMSTKALLNKNVSPSEEDIAQGLSGNMCRCTGYQNINRAVKKCSQDIDDHQLK